MDLLCKHSPKSGSLTDYCANFSGISAIALSRCESLVVTYDLLIE